MDHGDAPVIEPDYENGRWLLRYMGDPPDGVEQTMELDAEVDDEDSARDEAAGILGCEPDEIELG